MAKLSVKDLEVRGKRVFMRADFNVPLEEKDGQMVITDETRIREFGEATHRQYDIEIRLAEPGVDVHVVQTDILLRRPQRDDGA